MHPIIATTKKAIEKEVAKYHASKQDDLRYLFARTAFLSEKEWESLINVRHKATCACVQKVLGMHKVN